MAEGCTASKHGGRAACMWHACKKQQGHVYMWQVKEGQRVLVQAARCVQRSTGRQQAAGTTAERQQLAGLIVTE
eukprot:555649-Pelagomonas_calceolata.AAC.5